MTTKRVDVVCGVLVCLANRDCCGVEPIELRCRGPPPHQDQAIVTVAQQTSGVPPFPAKTANRK